MLPAAGRSAGLAGLGPPPPAREDGHALLFAETPVGAVARLDLLAHAAFALDHFQQLAVALAGRLRRQGQRQRQRQRRVGLCPFLPPPAPTRGERKKGGVKDLRVSRLCSYYEEQCFPPETSPLLPLSSSRGWGR